MSYLCIYIYAENNDTLTVFNFPDQLDSDILAGRINRVLHETCRYNFNKKMEYLEGSLGEGYILKKGSYTGEYFIDNICEQCIDSGCHDCLCDGDCECDYDCDCDDYRHCGDDDTECNCDNQKIYKLANSDSIDESYIINTPIPEPGVA